MKFIPLNIQNLKIAVYKSEGEGFPVVFLHANSIGAASFYNQMISKEGEKLQFFSIDLPGHGASDFSFKPEEYYRFEKLCEIMIETISKLNIGKFILVGHFHGAHIALNIASRINNAVGIVLSGFSPLKDYTNWDFAYKTDVIFNLFHKHKIDTEAAARLAQVFVCKDNAADISFVDNIKNTDPNYRKYLYNSYKELQINDFNLIKNLKIPIAVVLGEKDKIVRTEHFENIIEKLWRNKLHYVSKSGNSPMWENPKTFNYFILEFINDLI